MSMTKERAISLLRRYRQEELSPPEHYCLADWTMYKFGERVYSQYLKNELIKRIENDESDDVLMTITKFIYEYDRIAHPGCVEKNSITWKFCSNVIKVLDNLQQYLGERMEEFNV